MIARIIFVFIAVMSIVPVASAQPGVHTSKTGRELLRQIRKEKLDLILPGAMRDNNVDMWIHVTRNGDPDPLAYEFGLTSGFLIFTDLGNKIERAMFAGVFGGAVLDGGSGAVASIDILGSNDVSRAIEGYDYGKIDFSVYSEITEFVTDRDPKTIAVNFSNWLAVADGISYTQYLKLEKILGPKYSRRIVSAENVITDFRVRRVQSEVTAYTKAIEIHYRIVERALSREVITPGVTTLGDIDRWANEQCYAEGLIGYSTGPGQPVVYYSAQSEPVAPPSVRAWISNSDYVIQRGDFIALGGNLEHIYMNIMTETKMHAYVMREGEAAVPASLQRAFDRTLEAREIYRKNVKVGRTAGETLKVIVSALEEAGYIYTPYLTDIGTEDYISVQKALANTDKPGFSIDLHSMFNSAGSLVTVGPSVAPFRSDRDHLTIQENFIFAGDFFVTMNIPERPGFPLTINLSNPQIVTSRGAEWLHPPEERIILIH